MPVTADSVTLSASNPTKDRMAPLKRAATPKPSFTIHQYTAPSTPSRRFPVWSSSKSHTSAVMLIMMVNKLPMPNEWNGSANKNKYGLPGMKRNQNST